MKIAIIIEDLAINGGRQRQALELAIGLKSLGNHVDIFTKSVNYNLCYPELLNSVNILSTETGSLYRPICITDSFFKIIILFLNNRLKKFSENKCLVNLIKLHNSDLHYDIVNFHDDTIVLSKYFPSKICVWMMNDFPVELISGIELTNNSFSTSFKTLLYSAYKFLFQYFFPVNVSDIIVLDNRNKIIVRNNLKRNAIVVRSGLDLDKFASNRRKKKHKIHTVINLLCVSIFFRHRRYEDVIQAIVFLTQQGICNFHLNIVGRTDIDYVYYTEILSMIKKYNLEEFITILGGLPENELNEEYCNSDIFIFPNFPQTWGLSVFEAMLAGCAVILSNGCGAHEVLKNNVNAIIYPYGKPKILAQKLRLLIENPHLIESISSAGKDFVVSNISWKNYVGNMHKIFLKKT